MIKTIQIYELDALPQIFPSPELTIIFSLSVENYK